MMAMMYRLQIWLCAIMLGAGVAVGQTLIEVPGEGTFPEGIALDASTGELFVGGAGDGSIHRIDVDTGAATALLEPGSRPPFTTLGLALGPDGSLWLAGGGSGTIVQFDRASGDAVATFETPDADNTLINDVIVAPNGDVFATDSFRPALFRVAAGDAVAEVFVDFEGTVFEYGEGVNSNGLVVSSDGEVIIVVAMNTGTLYRIDVATREVSEIDVDGGPFTGGDGLVLDGSTLYVAQQGPDVVAVIELADDFASGQHVDTITDESFTQIATIALGDGALYVVNTQFGAMQSDDGPSLPFTVTVIDVSN